MDRLFMAVVVTVVIGYILFINYQLTIEHLARQLDITDKKSYGSTIKNEYKKNMTNAVTFFFWATVIMLAIAPFIQ